MEQQFLLADLIPVEILQEMQDAFSNFTGMAALTADANGTALTEGSNFTKFCMELTRKSELGCKNCEACDRQGAIMTLQSGKPCVYRCHAGLVDYAAPIMLNGEYIGSFIGGQVRVSPVVDEEFRAKAVEYGIDPDEYVEAAKLTEELPEERINKAAEFLSEMASVFSKMAYQRYLALEQKLLIERSAGTQTEALDQFSEELKHNFGDLTDFLLNLNEDTFHPDNPNSMMNYTYAMTLANNTMLLGTMLDDVVDYMHIENGTFELNESAYDIRQIVQVKLTEYTKRAEDKKNKLICNIGEDVPTQLFGDPTRIGGIIGKLIENSIRYTDDDEIKIDINVKKQGYAAMLEIKVSDNGVGMDAQDVKKIHDYMTSRGFSKSENKELSQLGFSLIGYAVNAMSGRADIKSRLGKGTTFTVKIPQLAVE